MLLNVLHKSVGDLLTERNGQLGQLRVLQEAHVRNEVLHRILGDGRLEPREVPLEDHRVLLIRGDGPRDLWRGTEILLRSLAICLQEVRGDLVELGWVRHDDEVLGEGGVEHLG